jgi:hypothetical protein
MLHPLQAGGTLCRTCLAPHCRLDARTIPPGTVTPLRIAASMNPLLDMHQVEPPGAAL